MINRGKENLESFKSTIDPAHISTQSLFNFPNRQCHHTIQPKYPTRERKTHEGCKIVKTSNSGNVLSKLGILGILCSLLQPY